MSSPSSGKSTTTDSLPRKRSVGENLFKSADHFKENHINTTLYKASITEYVKDTNHEYFGELLYRERLGALPPLLALGAGGFLVAVQRLLFGEVLEALRQPQLTGPLRYRQREIPERVESHRTVAAVRATQRRFQLSYEQVHYSRVLGAEVPLPGFRRLFHIATTLNRLNRIEEYFVLTNLSFSSISDSIGFGFSVTRLTSS